jgi:hypothetical protein
MNTHLYESCGSFLNCFSDINGRVRPFFPNPPEIRKGLKIPPAFTFKNTTFIKIWPLNPVDLTSSLLSSISVGGRAKPESQNLLSAGTQLCQWEKQHAGFHSQKIGDLLIQVRSREHEYALLPDAIYCFWQVPINWPSARMWPSIASSNFSLVAPGFKSSMVSSA